MANLMATPPETDRRDEATGLRNDKMPGLIANLGGEDVLKQEGIFASIWHSIEDAFFPKKLPPLVLESRPIAVVDPMAVKRDPMSVAIAAVFHALVIGLVIWLVAKGVKVVTASKQATIVALDAPPPKAPPRLKMMGGGGGQKGPAPVSKGSPPKFSPNQIVPPKLAVDKPKLAVLPTIDVDPNLHMQTNMPDIGVSNAPKIGLSMGNGSGNGLGGGNGNGLGPGSGGNTGGGVRQVGGGVSAPQLVYKVEAEFSEEARKAKVSGNVVVGLVVDEKGNATHVHVVRGLGMGLDEKAIEAVRQFRFKPAMENGKPVKVEVNVEVNFQIF
jgi:protein TonB